jgi:plasmid stabilization system protein ParE
MSGYSFHPEAFAHLDEIWEYIAKDNIDAADRVLADIPSALRVLVASPHIGHRRPDLTNRTLRFHLVRDEYLIAYARRAPAMGRCGDRRSQESACDCGNASRSRETLESSAARGQIGDNLALTRVARGCLWPMSAPNKVGSCCPGRPRAARKKVAVNRRVAGSSPA